MQCDTEVHKKHMDSMAVLTKQEKDVRAVSQQARKIDQKTAQLDKRLQSFDTELKVTKRKQDISISDLQALFN